MNGSVRGGSLIFKETTPVAINIRRLSWRVYSFFVELFSIKMWKILWSIDVVSLYLIPKCTTLCMSTTLSVRPEMTVDVGLRNLSIYNILHIVQPWGGFYGSSGARVWSWRQPPPPPLITMARPSDYDIIGRWLLSIIIAQIFSMCMYFLRVVPVRFNLMDLYLSVCMPVVSLFVSCCRLRTWL